MCLKLTDERPHLLPAQVGGDLMEMQVVSELLYFELHELRSLHQVPIETLTGVTEARAWLELGRATAAIVLLTVHTHMLRETDTQRGRWSMRWWERQVERESS